MKIELKLLSDRLQDLLFMNTSDALRLQLANQAKCLEADSALLDGVIELFQYGALMQMHTEELPEAKNYYFALCGDVFVGQTPREAIEAAVGKYMEGTVMRTPDYE